MLNGMEELTLQVSYLIPFKSCFKVFPVINYTYEPCLKVAMLCVFALCGLGLFMVISKKVTSLSRRLKGF